MNQITLMVFAISCTLTGCTSIAKDNSPTFLDDDLSQSFTSLDQSLIAKRSTLVFNDGPSVDNCEAYNAAASEFVIEETVQNQLMKGEYLICDAQKLLSDSVKVPAEEVDRRNLGQLLLSKLDLRSFPSSLKRMVRKESPTLELMFPENASFSDNMAVLKTNDLLFTVKVAAIADINHNSTPDWIVWVSDEARTGNYRSYSTIVLYDPRGEGLYSATVHP